MFQCLALNFRNFRLCVQYLNLPSRLICERPVSLSMPLVNLPVHLAKLLQVPILTSQRIYTSYSMTISIA